MDPPLSHHLRGGQLSQPHCEEKQSRQSAGTATVFLGINFKAKETIEEGREGIPQGRLCVLLDNLA